MNKQQLAAKIWQSANKMRSKIEASEYKDYILGFIFYKFLSENEVEKLKARGWDDESLTDLTEDDAEVVKTCKDECGYFIAYDNLFSTWLEKGKSFGVDDVRIALSAFSRNINDAHKKVYDKILDTLSTGLSKLGTDTKAQSKAVRQLVRLIKDIPMDGKQDYDVLGFIYEYLISNFAANAGKKAGEFYTPHEIALLMSEIVAWHLRDREQISIYDPTSGSGSLLLNIGLAVAKKNGNPDSIKYFAQELKEPTYNLTRMNLVMRGILPDNIVVRNGDTLEDDWPWFEEGKREETYEPLFVDAVVSNPPYSQHWDPTGADLDKRFSYGVAPKGKADLAFLLHDLYHLRADGIMCIVLPHGVLFRGGSEGEIRKNLIEHNNIQAIIGMPPNVFYGTGIPTIVMVLRKNKNDSNVLIVDASKHFIKADKKNKLQASDIKRIVDVVTTNAEVEKFSKLVNIDEIRRNNYNLNIPRYVDSSVPAEPWDMYALMYGGIPVDELNSLDKFWREWPSLKGELYTSIDNHYMQPTDKDVHDVVLGNKDVKEYISLHENSFEKIPEYLREILINGYDSVDVNTDEQILFDYIEGIRYKPSILDAYDVYQIFDNSWGIVSQDIEVLQRQGFEAVRKVDENWVLKQQKSDDDDADEDEKYVQKGWLGRILPFELVQEELLPRELDRLKAFEAELYTAQEDLNAALELLDEEELDTVSEDGKFKPAKCAEVLGKILEEVKTHEIKELNAYLALLTAKAKKNEKLDFISSATEIDWTSIEPNRDGTYGKAKVQARIKELQIEALTEYDPDSYECKLLSIQKCIHSERSKKRTYNAAVKELTVKTKALIESLDDSSCKDMLYAKWIKPLMINLRELVAAEPAALVLKTKALNEKYATTYSEIYTQINAVENELTKPLNKLTGNDYDMAGIAELQKLLDGE